MPIGSFPDAYNYLNDNADTTFLEYPAYEEVVPMISQFDGIFPNAKMRIDDNLLAQAKELKAISIPAMGTDNIDLTYCSDHGIKVFSLSDAKEFMSGIPSTAEYTIALILSLLKNIYHSTRSVLVESKWVTSEFRGFDLKGKTIGIIGYGVVGRKVAQLLSVFGVEILVYDPFIKIEDPDVRCVEINDLLQKSEIITVHVPLTEQTKHLLDRKQFSLMNNALFVNASRGEVINDLALLEALESSNVRAAALDVISNESDIEFSTNPLINYARSHDNLIITPHCAGSSNDALKQTFLFSAKKLINHLESS